MGITGKFSCRIGAAQPLYLVGSFLDDPRSGLAYILGRLPGLVRLAQMFSEYCVYGCPATRFGEVISGNSGSMAMAAANVDGGRIRIIAVPAVLDST